MAGENSEADGAGAQAQADDGGVGSESQRCLEATVTDEITCALRAMKGENESQQRLKATVIWLADQLRRMTFTADGLQARAERAERAEAKLAAAPPANDIEQKVLQDIANQRSHHIDELKREAATLRKPAEADAEPGRRHMDDIERQPIKFLEDKVARQEASIARVLDAYDQLSNQNVGLRADLTRADQGRKAHENKAAEHLRERELLREQVSRLGVDHANVHSWWTASQNRVGDLQRHRDELIKEIEELQENGRERDKQNRKLANALKRAMKGKRAPVKRKTEQ